MTRNPGNVTPLRPALTPLARVLRHIEANLDQPLSVATLAAITGFSPFHFARLFASQTGLGPMSYVRRRRLQLAVRRLSEPTPPDLVQLAFECGFDSQEAFTRAFKQGLGVTPGRFKRNAIAMRDMMEMPMDTATIEDSDLVLLDGLRRREAFRIAGLSMPLDAASGPKIPDLWRDLLRRLPLPGQKGRSGYGVVWQSDRDSGGMTYLAGFEVARVEGARVEGAGGRLPGEELPGGIARVDLPDQTYRVFRLTLDGSSLHPQVKAAMREIYEVRIPRAGWELAESPDFEAYNADFNPMRKGETLEFWVPVKA